MKGIKKILIVISIVVVVLVAIIFFVMNYDIKVIKETSKEYKDLYNISSVDFYKNNHLLVKELDIDGDEIDNVGEVYTPSLDDYENYKPEYIDRYKNIDNQNDNKYIEVYRLYLTDDDFYKNELKDFFDITDKVYMKIGINNMNLITFISLTKSIDGEDVYGPMIYKYYHDKS